MGGPDIDLESREGSVFLATDAGFHPSSIVGNSSTITAEPVADDVGQRLHAGLGMGLRV
jgi:hypothetical protein